jgi:hypothetical protein
MLAVYTLYYVCLAITHTQLTKTVSQDKQLANRVNRQAYLYRVGAELKGDKFLAVDDLQNLRDTARSSSGHSLRQVIAHIFFWCMCYCCCVSVCTAPAVLLRSHCSK